MVLITVFTPTYNREHLLNRCYESLCRQTSYNFCWLIVNDGSTDGTRDMVNKWVKNENRFQIQYVEKENGGLHTAYNVAVAQAKTELFTCLESDDYFTDDAIETIERVWTPEIRDNYVGFISLCIDVDGRLIGDEYPSDLKSSYYYNHRKNIHGDKQYVFKTSVLKQVFPQKSFEGEKYFDPKYTFFKIDKIGQLAITNEKFDVTDYQSEGLTKNIFKQYLNSPNSFAEYRKMYMQLPNASFGYLFRQNIHYVSSCCLAHKLTRAIKESPRKGYTLLAIIPGVFLTCYIRWKVLRYN